MFVEQKDSARLEHTPRFPNNGVRVSDHAEHKSRHYRVKAGIREWQALADLLHHGSVTALLPNMPSQTPDHVRVGFDKYDACVWRIVGQVRTCAAANFEDIARCYAGGALAVGDYAPFYAGVEEVVPGCEEALAEGHGEFALVGLDRCLFARGLFFIHKGQIDIMPLFEIASALYHKACQITVLIIARLDILVIKDGMTIVTTRRIKENLNHVDAGVVANAYFSRSHITSPYINLPVK